MILQPGQRLEPETLPDLVQAVRQAGAQALSLVPEGGQTGLVGGTLAGPAQVVLSLRRMNRILRLDPVERVAVVEAGVTLQTLQEAAAAFGLEPGIDLAARGSATIGGMVSTNAGGVMAFRNGVMRHRVLGLRAVLPDGSVYDDLTRVVKNAAGYDLKQLFIGAEGSLGVVAAAAIRLDVAPSATATALFALPDVALALQVVDLALRLPQGQLRAAEALWRDYIRLTAGAQGWQDAGLPLDQPIYLLLSLGGAEEAPLRAAFEDLFDQVLRLCPQAGGLVAGSVAQERALWRLREDTYAIYRRHPAAPSFDVSVPLSEIPAYVDGILSGLAKLEPGLAPYLFGHLADGNLHVVLNTAGPLQRQRAAAVEAVLYRGLREQGGSFSAEHGIGSKRIDALLATADPVKLETMRRIKAALDPAGAMNPGKVLPLAGAKAGPDTGGADRRRTAAGQNGEGFGS